MEPVILGDEWSDGPALAHEVLTAEDAHRAATMYLSMGWGVVAGPGVVAGRCSCPGGKDCNNPGKHAYKGWGEPHRKIATQAVVNKLWDPDNPRWMKKPVDQVFIVPYLSCLIVADVDDMVKWLALDEELRPETLWASSGSGRGGHFYYRYEWDLSGPAPSLPGKLPGGAGELKFRGIVAAPPSVHAKGGRYRWQNWGTEIAPVPEKFLTRWKNPAHRDLSLDTVVARDPENPWLEYMFFAEKRCLEDAGEATSSRPIVLFAAAATMSKWVAGGWITEEKVIEALLDAADKNGALDKYGVTEITRQLKNGLEAGLVGE